MKIIRRAIARARAGLKVTDEQRESYVAQ